MLFLIGGFLGTDFSELIKNVNTNYYVARLIGHNTNDKFISNEEMINNVLREYELVTRNEKNVFILGFSMGGLIASMIARYYSNSNLKGVILINPAFQINSLGDFKLSEFKFDLKKIYNAGKLLPKGLLKSLKELKKLNEDALYYDFISYDVKTLLILSTFDNLLHESNNTYLINNLKNKDIKVYNGNHDILKSKFKYLIFKDIDSFISENEIS